jgi:hypothetical protein
MAVFVIKCDLCKERLHKTCLLSLCAGKQKVCVACYESRAFSGETLDDHMYTPFEPDSEQPYHAFTFNYSAAKKNAMEVTCLFDFIVLHDNVTWLLVVGGVGFQFRLVRVRGSKTKNEKTHQNEGKTQVKTQVRQDHRSYCC